MHNDRFINKYSSLQINKYNQTQYPTPWSTLRPKTQYIYPKFRNLPLQKSVRAFISSIQSKWIKLSIVVAILKPRHSWNSIIRPPYWRQNRKIWLILPISLIGFGTLPRNHHLKYSKIELRVRFFRWKKVILRRRSIRENLKILHQKRKVSLKNHPTQQLKRKENLKNLLFPHIIKHLIRQIH